MPLPRKDSPSSTRFQRRGREPCFPQTARGPGPLGTMLSAALAIANAVQFSVCSGVLRVLGLARALPRDIVQKTNAPQRPNMVFGAPPRFVPTEGGSGMRWPRLGCRTVLLFISYGNPITRTRRYISVHTAGFSDQVHGGRAAIRSAASALLMRELVQTQKPRLGSLVTG